jgi:hypothetical protein
MNLHPSSRLIAVVYLFAGLACVRITADGFPTSVDGFCPRGFRPANQRCYREIPDGGGDQSGERQPGSSFDAGAAGLPGSSPDTRPAGSLLDAPRPGVATDSSVTGEGYRLDVVLSGDGAGNVVDLDDSARLWCRPACFASERSPACGGVCSARYPAGARVRLSVQAPPPAFLAQWSGACSGAGACIVEMTADRQIDARFDLDGVTHLESVRAFPQNGLFVLDGLMVFVAFTITGPGTVWNVSVPAEPGPVGYLAGISAFNLATWLRRYEIDVSFRQLAVTNSGDVMIEALGGPPRVVKYSADKGFMPLPLPMVDPEAYFVGLGKTAYLVSTSVMTPDPTAPDGYVYSWISSVYDTNGSRVTGPVALGTGRAFPLPDGGVLVSSSKKLSSSGAVLWDSTAEPQGAFVVDDAGDIYVAGRLTGQMTIGSSIVSAASGEGIFLFKRSGASGRVLWARGADAVRDARLAVGGDGIYLAGTATTSPILLPGYGNGGRIPGTGFVARFDSGSGAPLWAAGVDGEVRAVAASAEYVAVHTNQPSRLFHFKR